MPPEAYNALKAADWFCELLWPSRCGGCNCFIGTDVGFCSACQVSVLTLAAACPRCAMPRDLGANSEGVCGYCMSRPWHLFATRCGALYGGALVTAIVRFKHGRQDLLRTLAQLLAAGLSELSDVDTILAPVPLHPRRLRQRGFNQAWELARYAARQLPRGGRPRLMPSALVRVRDSPKPDGVDHRKLRAEGAFQVPNAQAIRGKTVILVDDVMTTGATLNACAVVLVEAGAKAVCAVTVARAV